LIYFEPQPYGTSQKFPPSNARAKSHPEDLPHEKEMREMSIEDGRTKERRLTSHHQSAEGRQE
jgi:hypothetical protein